MLPGAGTRSSGGGSHHFGPIASGDEDIMAAERKRELHKLTGAVAVAWEGAGGARACQFSETPFIEVRGISDVADRQQASDFKANLERVMGNVATLIIQWAGGGASTETAS